MSTSNLALLTRSHSAIAAKKRVKKAQIKEILFDDEARREFLTGFHKRKLAKADAARKKAMEREKQERLEARREQRRMLRERAIENAAQVEKAYGAIPDGHMDHNQEWGGISVSESKGKAKAQEMEREYEDEEILATVTVVEDFDPDSFIHGPRITSSAAAAFSPTEATTSIIPSRRIVSTPQTFPTTTPSNTKPDFKKRKTTSIKNKKIRYETKDARKLERTKQRARRTEKAELAGGKSGRKDRGGSKINRGRKRK